ncbi:hypothetical protein AB0D32_09410 [Micromonospora sp. NPDC048170]|uniref:hypothetical protein n=1 Tax=Micromonospora sp. NPDC048170 TaxID=3154819 RepID=UPI0033C635A1
MAARHIRLPESTRDRLQPLNSTYGNIVRRCGKSSPEALAARVERDVTRVEIQLEALVNSAPAPNSEQLARLRSLLPPVTGAEGRAA